MKLSRIYLGSVALALTITCFLKVISLRLLQPQVADPVISFLSVRATTVIAALIELSVLVIVCFFKSEVLKLMAVAWLGLSFLFYKLLWTFAVPATTPCPCLGLLLQNLGAPIVLGQTITWALLAYFTLGSIAGLARMFRSHHLLNNSANKATSALSPIKSGDLPCAICLFLMMTTARARDVKTTDSHISPPSTLRISGTLLRSYTTGRPEAKMAFVGIFSTNSDLIIIKTNPEDQLDDKQYFFDGKESSHVTIHNSSLTFTVYPTNINNAITWRTNDVPMRAKNDGIVVLTKGSMPEPSVSEAIPIWLAFAASDFLKHYSQGKMPKLFDLLRADRKGIVLVDSHIERSAFAPFAPISIVNREDWRGTRITNEVFSVSEWEDRESMHLPMQFSFSIYDSYSESKGKLLSVTECTVTNVSVSQLPSQDSVQWPKVAKVVDERLWDEGVPIARVTYLSTNLSPHTIPEIKKTMAYRGELSIAQSKEVRKVNPILLVALLIVIIFPLAVAGWRRFTQKS